jgi:hypothetical protein
MTFVPMPNLPPELAAAARAAAATLDHRAAGRIRPARINDCRDGHLCVSEFGTRGWVFYPLEPLRFPDILWPPPEPEPPRSTDEDYYVNEFTIGGGRGGADVCVSILSRSSWQHQRTAVDVYERGGGGAWRNLASMELELPWSAASHLPFIDGRLYLVASASAVAAMRLASCIPADVPTIALPEGLESRYDGSYEIAVASDRSGLHLARRDGFQIHVLHHRIDGGGCGCDDGWSLVDTVCLRDVCSGLGLELPSLAAGGEDGVLVHALGDDAEFVFLQVGDDVLCVHVKSKVAEKVYTMTMEDEGLLSLAPLVMPWPWPPVFPAVRELRAG